MGKNSRIFEKSLKNHQMWGTVQEKDRDFTAPVGYICIFRGIWYNTPIQDNGGLRFLNRR